VVWSGSTDRLAVEREKGFLVYPVAVANPIWIDVDGKIAPASPYRN
jgi:hypothetical protein